MTSISDWIWNEIQQIGKDYESLDEVKVYDESHAKFRDVEKESNDIFNYIGIADPGNLVDFGCGTGAFIRIADSKGWRCTGVDVSNAMLSYAKSLSVGDSISYVSGGFLTFEGDEGNFDLATSSFSFHHLPDFFKFIALKRVRSLLRDDGYFFIQDVIIEKGDYEANINALIDYQFSVGGDFLREDVIQHFKEEFSTFDWIIEGLIKRSGFMIEKKQFQGGLLGWYLLKKVSNKAMQTDGYAAADL